MLERDGKDGLFFEWGNVMLFNRARAVHKLNKETWSVVPSISWRARVGRRAGLSCIKPLPSSSFAQSFASQLLSLATRTKHPNGEKLPWEKATFFTPQERVPCQDCLSYLQPRHVGPAILPCQICKHALARH